MENDIYFDNEGKAIAWMERYCKSPIKKIPYPSTQKTNYYISKNGDVFSVMSNKGKYLAKKKQIIKTSKWLKVRFPFGSRKSGVKEKYFLVCVLVYCTFVLDAWNPEIEIDYIDGNQFNVNVENLKPKSKEIPQSWLDEMEKRSSIYKTHFLKVAHSIHYVVTLDFEDCKDMAQQAFLYICTNGNMGREKDDEEFVGLWIKVGRFRAIDRLRRQEDRQVYGLVETLYNNYDKWFEFDFFRLLPPRAEQYTRLYFEGNTPTEISQMLGVSLGTISSTVTRSIQLLRKHFSNEITKHK